MILARRVVIQTSCLVAVAATAGHSQSLSSSTVPSLAILAPTETQYDAGASGASGNYTVSTTCTGPSTAGCRLFLQYGTNSQGQQMGTEYAVVSISSSQCRGVAANPNVWMPVQPATVVLSTIKNDRCTATFRFRTSPLSWSQYQSPGPPGGSYRQQVAFVFTRP